MAWLLLVIAGIEEVIAVFFMKHVDGFKKKWPLIGMTIGFILTFYCLSVAMQEIPAGVAYGVWAGVGTVGIVLLGRFVFKEKYNRVQWLFLSFVVIGIFGMKMTV